MTSDTRQMRECTLHEALQLRKASDAQKIHCHWLLLNRTLYVMTLSDFLPLLDQTYAQVGDKRVVDRFVVAKGTGMELAGTKDSLSLAFIKQDVVRYDIT